MKLYILIWCLVFNHVLQPAAWGRFISLVFEHCLYVHVHNLLAEGGRAKALACRWQQNTEEQDDLCGHFPLGSVMLSPSSASDVSLLGKVCRASLQARNRWCYSLEQRKMNGLCWIIIESQINALLRQKTGWVVGTKHERKSKLL